MVFGFGSHRIQIFFYLEVLNRDVDTSTKNENGSHLRRVTSPLCKRFISTTS